MENEQLDNSLKCMEDTNKKLKSIYDERLNDKDKIINNLQDRIQNFLYDVRGCSWNNVPPSPKINKSKTIPGPVVEHVQNSQTSVTESQNTTHMDNNPTNHANGNGMYDVLMLHDSICRDIDIHRLLTNTDRNGFKRTTYTALAAQQFCEELTHATTTILHVGINDLKEMSVEEAFEMYETAVDKLLEKSDGLLLSLVIPCRYERLNQKVSEFNEKVKNKYLKMENIRIAFNSNFSQNGMICEHLFKDPIRLAPEGVGVLVGNLKRGLLIRVNGSGSYSRPPYQRTPNTRSNNLYRNQNMQKDRQNRYPYRNLPSQNVRHNHYGYNSQSKNKLNPAHLASSITAAILGAFNM